MALELIGEELNGLKIFDTKVFRDSRGFFMESFRDSDLQELGVNTKFIQDNHSRSVKDVLRGMHFQFDPPQGKLIRVTAGKAYIVEVDIRPGSPTFGKWFGIEISSENMRQIWVPPGFANGFCCLSDIVELQYKCTAYWNKPGEGSISWNDPDIGIKWPIDNPLLSEKDNSGISLKEWETSGRSTAFRYDKIKNLYT